MKRKLQRIFLFNCKTSNVIPQHILNNCYINIKCFSKGVQTKIEKTIQLFSKKMLEHEITDIRPEIQHIHKNFIFLILKKNYTGLQGFVVEKLCVVSGIIFDIESESGIRISLSRQDFEIFEVMCSKNGIFRYF